MKSMYIIPKSWVLVGVAAAAMLAGCERPPIDTSQNGYRGVAMGTVANPRTYEAKQAVNKLPEPIPAVPAPADGEPRAGAIYKNVQVLGDLGAAEFTRTMLAMNQWVAPTQGCTYCHAAGEDMSSDSMYTKVVARKMLTMTKKVNAEWGTHVGKTGVTCYTCHRGNNIPVNYWFKQDPPAQSPSMMTAGNGQNKANKTVGLASLPNDIFQPYLSEAKDIRVIGNTALPTGNRHSTKQAEWTYGLMVHMSEGLGVNCTYCHNTRSFSSWETSPPQRATAWYGIRMVRDLNNNYMEPLTAAFPAHRKGVLGDVAKVNCTTCHQAAYKPHFGASMLKDYPELNKAKLVAAAYAPASAIPSAAPGAPPMAAAPAAALASSGVLGKILFSVGKKDIDADGKNTIAAAAKMLAEKTDAKVDLSGFADKTGNPTSNLALAKDRAFAVRDALKAAGVAESRIQLKKPEFIVGGSEADSRRVDIVAAP
jgi:photosynthetic reaction center cytochrome c subunit